MRRKEKNIFIVALALLLASCLPAGAQQAPRIPRIGYVSGVGSPNNPGAQVEAFRRGLHALGYIEGKNILVEYRYHEGKVDRVPDLVSELVQLTVDVLVVVPSPAIRIAKQATKTIPIVMVTTQDPVETGLVDSLARPGGNITGLTRLTRDLNGKRLEFFKEALPTISRVGVLLDANTTSGRLHLSDYDTAARPLNVVLQSLEYKGKTRILPQHFRARSKAA